MERYKRILLTSIAVVFSFSVTTLSLANGIVAPLSTRSYFDGAYLGVGIGAVHAWSNVKGLYKVYPIANPFKDLESSIQDFELGEYGFDVNIFEGYGKTFRSSYCLSGEVFANYFSPEMRGSHDFVRSDYNQILWRLNMKTEVRNQYSFGGDIRAGYLAWSRMMFYVLLGLDYAKFDIKSAAENTGTSSYIKEPVSNEFNKWQLGFMPGIGMEIGLSNHMSLRAQYTYTFYPSFQTTLDRVENLVNPDRIYRIETKIKPHRDLFALKLSYLFNSNSNSFATSSSAQIKPYFGGAYLGIGGGAVHAWSDVENSYSVYKIGDPQYQESSTHDFRLGRYGCNANVFAGYGKVQSSYYLGGEIFANYFSLKMKGYHGFKSNGIEVNMNTEIKNPYSLGGDIRAGYLVSPRMMFYILLGLDYAKFNVKSKAISTGPYSFSEKPISNEFVKWNLGFMPGIGIETNLSDHVSLRAQYTHTIYPSFSYNTSFMDKWLTHDVKVNLKTTVRPQRDKITVMFSYLFN